MEKSSSALKTIFYMTSLRLKKSNCRLGLFDNTAGDQKSGFLPEDMVFFSSELLNAPRGNIQLKMARSCDFQCWSSRCKDVFFLLVFKYTLYECNVCLNGNFYCVIKTTTNGFTPSPAHKQMLAAAG